MYREFAPPFHSRKHKQAAPIGRPLRVDRASVEMLICDYSIRMHPSVPLRPQIFYDCDAACVIVLT
jgi:hypothetical protein